MAAINLIDTGLQPYLQVLQLQEELFNKNTTAKLAGGPTTNTLILCEHNPVYTLGKSGKRENILVPDSEMKAEFYYIQRGGDVTYHGPGQMVAYPVLDIDTLKIGLMTYINLLEETIIQSLKEFGLAGERIEGSPGIWIRDKKGDRKICAIGVKASRNITMHGLAININNDLSYFNRILACGIQGKSTTSLSVELGKEITLAEYKPIFTEKFSKTLGVQLLTSSR